MEVDPVGMEADQLGMEVDPLGMEPDQLGMEAVPPGVEADPLTVVLRSLLLWERGRPRPQMSA